jgi:hypothetical protein
MSLVERARIVRNLDEGALASALAALLRPGGGRGAGVLAGKARSVTFSQARFQAIPGRGGRPSPADGDAPEAAPAAGPDEPAAATAGGGPG